jgi:hypothetical protein
MLTTSHQCPIPHAAEACEINGPAQPSVRAPAIPRYSSLPGPTAASGRRTVRPTVAPVMQARLSVPRCRTPLIPLSCLHHASRVGRRRPQASPFQGLVLGLDYPQILLVSVYQVLVVDAHRRRRRRLTHLLLVTVHPRTVISRLPRVLR